MQDGTFREVRWVRQQFEMMTYLALVCSRSSLLSALFSTESYVRIWKPPRPLATLQPFFLRLASPLDSSAALSSPKQDL
jgi:hypothetical protein